MMMVLRVVLIADVVIAAHQRPIGCGDIEVAPISNGGVDSPLGTSERTAG